MDYTSRPDATLKVNKDTSYILLFPVHLLTLVMETFLQQNVNFFRKISI